MHTIGPLSEDQLAIQDGVAPIGRSLMRAVSILAIGAGQKTT